MNSSIPVMYAISPRTKYAVAKSGTRPVPTPDADKTAAKHIVDEYLYGKEIADKMQADAQAVQDIGLTEPNPAADFMLRAVFNTCGEAPPS